MKKIIMALAVVGLVAAAVGSAVAETYTMKAGDTLGGVAQQYLGNRGRWREIATLNNIADERRIPVGTVLQLPGARRARGGSDAGEPLATAPSTRRQYREGRDIAPEAPPAQLRQEEAPPTAYAQEEQEPIATSRTTRRRYRGAGDDIAPKARRNVYRHTQSMREGGGHTFRPQERYYYGERELPDAAPTTYPGFTYRDEPLAHTTRVRRSSPQTGGPTAYPVRARDSVFAEGAIGDRWRGERRGTKI